MIITDWKLMKKVNRNMNLTKIAGVKKRYTPTPATQQITDVSYIYICFLKYLNESIQFKAVI